MNPLPLLLPVACLAVLSSCVLPYPHRNYDQEGLSGIVIQTRTKQPVMGATIRAEYGFAGVQTHAGVQTYSDTARSGSDGRFKIDSSYTQHWAIFLSPISMSLLPTRVGPQINRLVRQVTISRPGYQTTTYERPSGGFPRRFRFTLIPLR